MIKKNKFCMCLLSYKLCELIGQYFWWICDIVSYIIILIPTYNIDIYFFLALIWIYKAVNIGFMVKKILLRKMYRVFRYSALILVVDSIVNFFIHFLVSFEWIFFMFVISTFFCYTYIFFIKCLCIYYALICIFEAFLIY